MMNGTVCLAALTALLLGAVPTVGAQEVEPTPIDEIPFNLLEEEAFLGDYPEMIERGRIRVLVPYDKTNFFIANGNARGWEHDLMRSFETALNHGKGRGELPLSVVFKPMHASLLLAALQEGRGDVVAAGLTITPERSGSVAFTRPYLTDIDEVVVSRLDRPAVPNAADLSRKEVWVLRNSSYAEHLPKLAGELEGKGIAPFQLIEADAALRTEDLLEMVNGGLIDYTVADQHKAALWANVLPNLRVDSNFVVSSGGRIAWAVRKNSPLLRDRLNEHIELLESKYATKMKQRFKHYYESLHYVRQDRAVLLSPDVLQLTDHFRKYSTRYDMDWLLMLAQGYQESGLNPEAVSHVGALGVMQLLPSTGVDMGFDDIRPAEPNIHAGIKYMDWIRTHYFDDPELASRERGLFALAAYNAGPNRVTRLRKKAPEMGLDPNLWFGNMELVILAHVGREPVQYVANIYKYYLAYSSPMFEIESPEQKREEIRFIQTQLTAKGYDAGGADGVMGASTREAIRSYQDAHGLAVDGKPSVSLVQHLKTD